MNEALQFMRKVFPLRTCTSFPDSPCLEYHIGQCLAPCVGYIDARDYARIVRDLEAFMEGRKDTLLRDLKRRMQQAARGMRYEEAGRLRDQIEALSSVVSAGQQVKEAGPLALMQRALKLTAEPKRIEAFDISHSFGTYTVASLVVFMEGKPFKSHYRRFRIEGAQNDDYASMREVVTRRYSGSLATHLPFPDLVIIDGGRGQLSAALEAIQGLKLKLPTIGIAKRFEHIILPAHPDPIVLLQNSPVLQLVQAIRDEAHRFAITYHRRLRGKAMEVSVLEQIPGIGKKRAQQLLVTFGGMGGIAVAGIEDLRKAARLSRVLAEAVQQAAVVFARTSQAREGLSGFDKSQEM
jgi:excinuclease ABC subunit C